MFVYRITHKESRTTYIGSTSNFKKRWGQHLYELRRGSHYNDRLQKAWNKHGEESFEWSVLEFCITGGRLAAREQWWLDKFRASAEVYNCGMVAKHPTRGLKVSEEWRLQNAKRKAQPYPAFRNIYTGEIIPAGVNLSKLCRDRGLDVANMHRIRHGVKISYKGWKLASGKRKNLRITSYPMFQNEETGEIIPAGENLRRMCLEKGLRRSHMSQVKDGKRRMHSGWVLA